MRARKPHRRARSMKRWGWAAGGSARRWRSKSFAADSPLPTGRKLAGRTKISKIFQRNLSRRNGFTSADARQTIAQRFEQQTRRYPHRLALKLGVRSLSYAELNSAANR